MNQTIILTRPQGQNQPLIKHFKDSNSLEMPCLLISKNPHFNEQACLEAIKICDLVIVTSVNALKFITLPASMPTILAIGPATQRYLVNKGHHSVELPDTFNSEGIIAWLKTTPQSRKTVALLTRLHSSSPIESYLSKQAISLSVWPSYQSAPSTIDFSKIDQSNPATIVFTSSMGLENWIAQIPSSHKNWFRHQQVVVINKKMLAFCLAWGMIKAPWLADNATNEAIIQCIDQHNLGIEA